MTLRSLVLVVLIAGVSTFQIREASAITSCAVCADGAHPCSFKCFTDIVTTCKGAGYACVRVPALVETAPSLDALALDSACPVASAEAPASELSPMASWLDEGLAFVHGLAHGFAAVPDGLLAALGSPILAG